MIHGTLALHADSLQGFESGYPVIGHSLAHGRCYCEARTVPACSIIICSSKVQYLTAVSQVTVQT